MIWLRKIINSYVRSFHSLRAALFLLLTSHLHESHVFQGQNWSGEVGCTCILFYFKIESTVAREDSVEEAFERKKLRYADVGTGSWTERMENLELSRLWRREFGVHGHSLQKDKFYQLVVCGQWELACRGGELWEAGVHCPAFLRCHGTNWMKHMVSTWQHWSCPGSQRVGDGRVGPYGRVNSIHIVTTWVCWRRQYGLGCDGSQLAGAWWHLLRSQISSR